MAIILQRNKLNTFNLLGQIISVVHLFEYDDGS